MHRRRLFLVLPIVSAFVALISGATLFAQPPTPIYVDADAVGLGNGASWEDAYNDLQTALSVAVSGDEIWVAEGVYYPDKGVGQVDDAVTSTFVLTDGVVLYGGFDPGSGVETMAERDWETYVTVLSGDIDHETHPDTTDPRGVVTDTANIAGSNACHVIHMTGASLVDGFTITAGQAVAHACDHFGGGVYNNAGGSPTLVNVVVSGNKALWGGGMYNVQNGPTLTNVTFSGNAAARHGGGMYNDRSTLVLTGVSFSGNLAVSMGGEGGGMYNTLSTLSLTDVAFSDNRARRTGGGMVNKSSNVTLMTAAFSNNQAGETGWMGAGGGMYNYDSTLTLADVVFSGNLAFIDDGGAINNRSSRLTVTNATFSGNVARGGGGILHTGSDSSLDLTNVTFSGNSATRSGGGLASQADVTLTDVTFSENAAEVGGGMSSGVAGISTTHTSLTNVAFVNNIANDRGGGLYHYNGDYSTFLTLTHVTFSTNRANLGGGMAASSRGLPILRNVVFTGNTAGEGGGGMYNKSYSNPRLFNVLFSGNTAGDYGGGIYNQSSSTMLMNVTLSGNTATALGGGIYNHDHGGSNLTNTILWNNTANSGNQVDNSDSTTSIGYSNVQGCGGSSGWVTSCGTDAGGNIDLNPLFVRDPDPGADGQWDGVDDDYGDLHLQSGSPAIDTGTNATFHYDCPPTDLDGNPRPVNGICDMGAYEYDPAPRLDINYDTGAPGSIFTVSGRNFPANATAAISVNGVALGTVPTDHNGGFSFLLSTQGAEEGVYFVKAAVNPSATVRFTLSAGKPIRAQQGSGTIFATPAGSAYTAFVYLPAVIRE